MYKKNEGLRLTHQYNKDFQVDIIVREIFQNPDNRRDLSTKIEVVEGNESETHFLHHRQCTNPNPSSREIINIRGYEIHICMERDINYGLPGAWVSLFVKADDLFNWKNTKYYEKKKTNKKGIKRIVF
jgi:hypothetical protein